MASKDEPKGRGLFKCDCGRTFINGGSYTKHKIKCDGKPVATSGQIAARDGAPAAVSAPSQTRHRNTAPAARRKRARIASKAVTRAKRAHKMSGRRPRPVPVSRPQVREQNRNRVVRIPLVLSPAAMLSALRAEAVKIQNAIAAIEALG
jgi:hypothetical protein